MTDEQINRVIAESLEPEAIATDIPFATDTFTKSKFGVWKTVRYGFEDWRWECGDFIHDPAMRDLLQAKLLEEGWAISIHQMEDGLFNTMLDTGDSDSYNCHQVISDRIHIWALAYMKAHGLEER